MRYLHPTINKFYHSRIFISSFPVNKCYIIQRWLTIAGFKVVGSAVCRSKSTFTKNRHSCPCTIYGAERLALLQTLGFSRDCERYCAISRIFLLRRSRFTMVGVHCCLLNEFTSGFLPDTLEFVRIHRSENYLSLKVQIQKYHGVSMQPVSFSFFTRLSKF